MARLKLANFAASGRDSIRIWLPCLADIVGFYNRPLRQEGRKTHLMMMMMKSCSCLAFS
jgi:hypothetical protein